MDALPTPQVTAPDTTDLPPPPDGRVLALDDLPDQVRQGLPDFTVTGSIWSEERSMRMLTVMGRILREGDDVAPGLRLEQIESDGAIFSWRGYRFLLPGP